MNHDTNCEDRVERAPTARCVNLSIYHADGHVEHFYPKTCLGCGARSDPCGNLPCPCGQKEESC